MPSSTLVLRLDQLIGYFNRRVMDVPEGLFDRNARFTLNGLSFEAMLGRDDDDPLIRMIARGAAGYRFAMRPLLHALETVLVSRVDVVEERERVHARLALRGTLRGSGEVMDQTVDVDLVLTPAGALARADVMIAETALQKIRAARSQP